MAKVLPRSSFQKLGLAAASLRSAMSSLSSNLTSMRTETNNNSHGGGRQSMTRRTDLEESNPDDVAGTLDDVKIFRFMAKWEWDPKTSGWTQVYRTTGQSITGKSYIMVARKYFAKGAERAAFECNEANIEPYQNHVYRSGPRLVAKESLFEEQHKKSLKLYSSAAKIQANASEYANQFNSAVFYHPHWISSWNIYFIKCCIYQTHQCEQDAFDRWRRIKMGGGTDDGSNWTLTEPELEGQYKKWNNNAGMVCL